MAWFPLQCALNSKPVIEAFSYSLGKLGIKFVENSLDCDSLLIWSVLWSGRMRPNREIFNIYRSSDRPVVIIEVGNLKRNLTWRVSINHITTQGYYGHQQNLDFDRPNKLGVSLSQKTKSNGKILIAAQHKDSLQLAGIDQESWIDSKIKEINQYTDRSIVIRPHPRSNLNFTRITSKHEKDIPLRIPNSYDDFNIDYNYHAVVNYSSGPGVQAGISGTSVVVNPVSLAYPISNNIIDIDQPKHIDKEPWLVEICHTEYTVDEIREGRWYTRLQDRL